MNFEVKNDVNAIFNDLFVRYPILIESKDSIWKMYELLRTAYEDNHILYIAGNGGSAADSEHIAGELMKSFRFKRPVDKDVADKLIKGIGYVLFLKVDLVLLHYRHLLH